MPQGQNEANIKITADSSQIERAMEQVNKTLDNMRSKASGIGVGNGANVGGNGSTSAAGTASGSASSAPSPTGRGNSTTINPKNTQNAMSGSSGTAAGSSTWTPTLSMASPYGSAPDSGPGASTVNISPSQWQRMQKQSAAQAAAMAPGASGGVYGPPSPSPAQQLQAIQAAARASAAQGSGGNIGPWGIHGGGYNGVVGMNGQPRLRLQGNVQQFLGLEALGFGARTAGTALDYQTNRILQGGDDPMGGAQAWARGISSVIGLAAGAVTQNPIIGMIAGGLSETVLDPLSRFLAAPAVEKEKADQSLVPYLAGRYGRMGARMVNFWTGDRFVNPGPREWGGPHIGPAGPPQEFHTPRLKLMTDLINDRFERAGLKELKGTLEQSGATLAAVNATLFNAGIDPEGPGETTTHGPILGPRDAEYQRGYANASARPFHNFRDFTGQLRDFQKELKDKSPDYIRGANDRLRGLGLQGFSDNRPLGAPGDSIGPGTIQEQLGETYFRRVTTLVGGKEAPAAWKAIAPMFGEEYGGNMTDLLMKFGPQMTSIFDAIHHKDMMASIDPMVLSKAFGEMQAHSRARSIAALSVRNKGEGMLDTAMADIATLGELPGGKDSIAYLEANAQRRQATQQMFHEQDVMQFDIPMSRINTAQRIHQYLPYQPGYGMAMSMTALSVRKPQIDRKLDRYRWQMAHGDLSEDQQLAAIGEIDDLRVAQARDIGSLAEGGANRITAAFAGMPSRRGRYDSMSIARTALWKSGHPRQDYGFANGAHAGASSSWFNQFGVSTDPISRTGEYNASYYASHGGGGGGMGGGGFASGGGAGGGLASNGPVIDWLRKIYQEIQKQNGPGSTNPAGGMQVASGRGRANDALALGLTDPRKNQGLRG